MTIILSYIAYFIFSITAPLLRRFLVKRNNPEASGQIRFAFEVMLMLALASILFQFFSPLYFAGSRLHLVLLALTCGISGMCYFIANYGAQKHVDAGVTIVVTNIYTPITIVLSSIFLSERLNPMQIVGTVLLLISMVIISKKHRIGKFRFDRYFMMMLLSGVFLSVLLVAERALQKQTGLSGATMLSWGSQFIFLGLAVWYTKSKHTYTQKEILSAGIFTALSSISYVILIYVVGNLSFVSSVTTFKIVLMFIAAAIFLHEREDLPRKILGSVIAVLGLLLMK
jgi:drug/metabolite transporter (DMT)-like permease